MRIVCLGVPVVVGSKGVEKVVDGMQWTDSEHSLLQQNAELTQSLLRSILGYWEEEEKRSIIDGLLREVEEEEEGGFLQQTLYHSHDWRRAFVCMFDCVCVMLWGWGVMI